MPPITWRSYSITLASLDFAAASIAIEEPLSSETRMTTLAPLARHWSACVFCFWALPSAFVITYETFAFVNAFTNPGRSWVSQRTEDFGSGRRTQTSAPPARFVGFATAEVIVTLTATAATTRATMVLFTVFPSMSFG